MCQRGAEGLVVTWQGWSNVGLSGLKGLFQSKQFCGSMTRKILVFNIRSISEAAMEDRAAQAFLITMENVF